jgi:murein DD-endopeptidase MepM/ murein hydrolase activator NlpD
MKRIFALLLIVFIGSSVPVEFATAQTAEQEAERSNLEQMIKAKSDELEKINDELETTQGNLQETKAQRQTLQREIKQLLGNIKQLELNIAKDKVTNQKLSLEIDSLNYDIRDIELSAQSKKNAIVHVLREIQVRDNTNPLIAFLRSGSLTETFSEVQELVTLKTQLSSEINQLNNLQNQLGSKIRTVSDKKTEIEFRQQTLAARKSLIEDQKQAQNVILAQTKNRESSYEQQVAELKKQQDVMQDEIAKIENQLKAKFDTGVLPSGQKGLLQWPIQLVSDGGKGRLTQHFGEVSNLYRGKPHNGTDIGAPVGTPVFAAADGVVKWTDKNDRSAWSKYQYGTYVLLEHPDKLATLYAHLSRFVVARGEVVKRGQLIGYSGNTGYSTGPHLHFGVYWAPSIELRSIPPASGLVPVGVVVDAEDYLPAH